MSSTQAWYGLIFLRSIFARKIFRQHLKTRKLCYRKDDRAMRPIYRLFYHNFVHAYIHLFVRTWFWTNLSWSDSAHWPDVDFEKPIVVTIAAHSNVCLHVLKHHLGVLDGDAPSPIEPPRMLYFIFLETKIMGLHFVLIVYLSYLSQTSTSHNRSSFLPSSLFTANLTVLIQ